MNIPEITIGSEKQIAWAKKIVAGIESDFDKLNVKPEFKQLVAAAMVDMFFNSNEASHFINLRNKYGHGVFVELFAENRQAILGAVKNIIDEQE